MPCCYEDIAKLLAIALSINAICDFSGRSMNFALAPPTISAEHDISSLLPNVESQTSKPLQASPRSTTREQKSLAPASAQWRKPPYPYRF